MSRVFVSNIPENFTPQDMLNLLQQAGVPCYYPEPLKIQQSRQIQPNRTSTGRYTTLYFDSEDDAATAIDVINMMVLTVDGKDSSLKAERFIANFNQLRDNQNSNLVVLNLPDAIQEADLRGLFSEFGTVCSVRIERDGAAPDSCKGFVLFQHENEARRAAENVEGKFLGPNKLYVKMYKPLEQRAVENREILVRNVPLATTAVQLKQFILKSVNMKAEDVFAGEMSLFPDGRPAEINSGCQQAIFSCTTPQIAQTVIQRFKALRNTALLAGAAPLEIMKKTRTGHKGNARAPRPQQKREQKVEPARNVQVIGLRADATADEVKAFFSNYGPIAQVSVPIRQDANTSSAIVYFQRPGDAATAIAKAGEDEQWSFPRIGSDIGQIQVRLCQNVQPVQGMYPYDSDDSYE